MYISILDNSTTTPFISADELDVDIISVIDNTKFAHTLNYGQPSKNHCSSIDYALNHCINTKYTLLVDNDIIFHPAINNLLQERHKFDVIGEIGYDIIPGNRLFPYMCLIDNDFMTKNNINYFDEARCMTNNTMDTGASFYEDCVANSANIKCIKLQHYITHLKGGTLHGKPLKF